MYRQALLLENCEIPYLQKRDGANNMLIHILLYANAYFY